MKPGIYFGLSENEYHADPALSTSALKKLIQDPEEYWDGSFMNPNPPPPEVKDCLARGTLWHCRILEPENFYNKYAPAPALTGQLDNVEILDTVADMTEWLDDNNLEYKKSWPKDKLADVIQFYWDTYGRSCCSTEPYLLARQNEAFAMQNPGKTIIWSEEIWDAMLDAESVVKAHPYFSKVFEGGIAEVSVFWTDPDTGLAMKCRIDKLKPGVILDYKTMNVRRGRSARNSALDAIKYEHYDIQTAMYTIGVAHAVNMINDGTGIIWGDVPGEFIDAFRQKPEKPFGFVFQKEDRPYTLRGLKVVRRGADTFNVFGAGLFYMQQGIQIYQEYMEKFGENRRWIQPDGMTDIGDHEIYYS